MTGIADTVGRPVPHAPGEAPPWRSMEVAIAGESYPYRYGYRCLDRIAAEIDAMEADRIVVVTDDVVHALHGHGFVSRLRECAPVTLLTAPAGEAMKSLELVARHAERAIEAGATRSSVVVAFGGGVVGNVAGLLASLLYRGVRLVHVPTTIMAAADSAISLKQGVNSPYGKNHLGAYHRPAAVLADVALFETLSAAELRSGLCEAIKNCLAIRPSSVDQLSARVIDADTRDPGALAWLLEESLAAKCQVMRADPREQREGLVLEYGHTVGHAVELCGQRASGAPLLSHGEAVAIGMVVAARIAVRRCWLDDADLETHLALLDAVGAPARVPAEIDLASVAATVMHDNKRGYLPVRAGHAPFVLLRALGVPARTNGRPLVEVAAWEMREALREAAR